MTLGAILLNVPHDTIIVSSLSPIELEELSHTNYHFSPKKREIIKWKQRETK